MSAVIEGVLRFYGLYQSWIVETDRGDVEVMQAVLDVIGAMHGLHVVQVRTATEFGISLDDASMTTLFANPNSGIYLTYPGGGFEVTTNVMEIALFFMNGRKVRLETDVTGFSIAVDPEEQVHMLNYNKFGNGCSVSSQVAQDVCQIGGGASCVFLSLDHPGGFTCNKFDPPTARMLLERLALGTIRSKRIGNCGIAGRAE